MAQVPKEFAADFEGACRHWRATGETEEGIEEIRGSARADFGADRHTVEWSAWVKDEADFQRTIEAMGARLNRPTITKLTEDHHAQNGLE